MPLLLRARTPDGALDPVSLAEAARLLRAGRLVAIPTETVYGLGANALDAVAVREIFTAKGRPTFNPLIVHVADVAAARALAAHWPDRAEALAQAFWPGPLTLVVAKSARIPREATAGLDAVGLRCPAHPVAHALLELARVPIAAPSANRSNAVSPTTAAHVVQSLGGRVDAVLDDGPCAVGIESTVLDLTCDPPRLLRPGGLDVRDLERVVGPITRAVAHVDEGARLSPGQQTRHYAPTGRTQLLESAAFSDALAALPPTARIGAIVLDAPRPADPRLLSWACLGRDPTIYAREIYAALHRLDEAGATDVLLEAVPADPAWDAVRDRLTRAAG